TYTAHPDPALNLPYRYDDVIYPELENSANLDRTKSIRFSRYLPQIGDTVSLFLKTFNYSFVETEPVEFQLYHGHPNEGGEMIEDVEGNTSFITSTNLEARGRVETEVKFVTTFDMVDADFTKIYAVLDPNDLIAEIHEDNNIGWAQLGYGCNQPGTATNVEELYPMPDETSILNIFPIPADRQTTIAYDVTRIHAHSAWITITDMVGKNLQHFRVSAAFQGKIYWNTSALDEGLYLVNFWSENGLLDSEKVIIQH
ncbi:MAG: T9SS type A sorting domain-containing protein, partial [Flavobacteriales bacterium]|nr:T9SS type A sorting domain-containing protein [Flavobacteriales bacterium]